MKRIAVFALAASLLIVGAALVTTFVSSGPGVAKAVWTSAVVAVVVQVAAFTLARSTQTTNVVAGWGSGMLIRFLSLVVYGFVGAKALGLAMTPALLSLAGFLFLTTLVEPAFLKP